MSNFIARQLLTGLNNTSSEDVLLDISQVISVIGLEETEKLCEVTTKMSSAAVKKKKSRPARTTLSGLGKFNRKGVINAIYKAQGSKVSGGVASILAGLYSGSGLRST